MDLDNPLLTAIYKNIEIKVYIKVINAACEPSQPSRVEPPISEQFRRIMPTPQYMGVRYNPYMNMIPGLVVTPVEPLASLPPPTPPLLPPGTPASLPLARPDRVEHARVPCVFVPDPATLRPPLAGIPSVPSDHSADAARSAIPRSPEKRARSRDLCK